MIVHNPGETVATTPHFVAEWVRLMMIQAGLVGTAE
jgi:hypothetical protein